MDPDALLLGELICARVCHDLGGLAGTLAGTLQLAQDDEAGEAVALARETADALARRLCLLRAALGPSSEPLGARGIADLAAGLDERVQVDLSGLGPKPLPGDTARLALAMLLLGAEALPMGGTLHVAMDGDSLRVTADGRRAAWPPRVAEGLDGALPDAPRDLLAPLCSMIAHAAGMSLTAENSPPRLCAIPFGRALG